MEEKIDRQTDDRHRLLNRPVLMTCCLPHLYLCVYFLGKFLTELRVCLWCRD